MITLAFKMLCSVLLFALLVQCSDQKVGVDARSQVVASTDIDQEKESSNTKKKNNLGTIKPEQYLVHRDKVPENLSPFQDKNKFLLNTDTDEAATLALNSNIDEMVLKAGTPVAMIMNHSCLTERKKESEWILEFVDPSQIDIAQTIKGQFAASFNLTEDLSVKKMNDILAKDPCVIGGSVANTKLPAPTADASVIAAYNQLPMNYTAADQTFFDSITAPKAPAKVRVAVIDTGFDVNNPNFAPEIKKSINASYGDLSDPSGHGTAVSAIIASNKYGLASKYVELIPIKLAPGNTATDSMYKAIAFAVNQGANVINISLTDTALGCDAVIGQAIYLAVREGIFFSVSAGNGIPHIPGVKVGYPLVASRDDGPRYYGRSDSPSCWANTFQGVVATTALQGTLDNPSLAINANFGDDIELAAPGVNVPSFGPASSEVAMSGPSIATAFVSSAAILSIYHHRAKGFDYDPWYIEDLLVNSAYKSTKLANQERRSRFGSIIDFTSLAALLAKTEKMTAQERRAIPTVNPRLRQGFNPGLESNLSQMKLKTTELDVFPADVLEVKSTVFYRDNKREEDKTLNPNMYWFASIGSASYEEFIPDMSKIVKIDRTGRLTIGALADYAAIAAAYQKKYGGNAPTVIPVTVLGVYDEDRNQIFDKLEIRVAVTSRPAVFVSFKEIVGPSVLAAGIDQLVFRAIGKFSDKTERDITEVATWTTSNADEFRLTAAPGIFSARYANIGGTYVITASYKGAKFTSNIKLKDEKITSFLAKSSVGNSGALEIGQVIAVEAQLNLDQRTVTIPANWTLDGKAFAKDSSKVTIDTATLAAGEHSIRADAQVKIGGTVQSVNNTYTFTLGYAIDRIEVLIKDSFVESESSFPVDVRAYRLNNSYEVVTDKATISIDNTSDLTLDKSGRVVLKSSADGKSFKITASYAGKTAETRFSVNKKVVITKPTVVDVVPSYAYYPNARYCALPYDFKFKAVYSDGTSKDVTSLTQYDLVHIKPSGEITGASEYSIFPGGKFRLRYSYSEAPINGEGGGNISKTDLIAVPTRQPVNRVPDIDISRPYSNNTGDIYIALQNEKNCGDQITAVSFGYLPTRMANVVTAPGTYSYLNLAAIADGVYPFYYTTSTRERGYFEYVTLQGSLTVRTQVFSGILTKTLPAKLFIKGADPAFVSNFGTGELPSFAMLDQYGNETSPAPANAFAGWSSANSKVTATVNGKNVVASIGSGFVDTRTGFVTFQYDRRWGNGVINFTVRHLASGLQLQYNLPVEVSPLAVPNIPVQANPGLRTIAENNKASSYCADAANNNDNLIGVGIKDNPYRICNATQLRKLPSIAGYVVLENHLDFANNQVDQFMSRISYLDGKGYEIRNFVNTKGGFFQYCPQVSNLGIRNARVNNPNGSAGTICALEPRSVSNSYVVNSDVSGVKGVGAFFGMVSSVPETARMLPAIIDSTINSTIITHQRGFAGGACGTCDVYNVSSNATIRQSGAYVDAAWIGGIAGRAIQVSQSFSRANITANGFYVGGISGMSEVIINSVAEGDIAVTGNGVGGLVGRMSSGGDYNEHSFFTQEDNRTLILAPYSRDGQSTSALTVGSKLNTMIIANSRASTSVRAIGCKVGQTEVLGPGGSTVACNINIRFYNPNGSRKVPVYAVGGLVGDGGGHIISSQSSSIVYGVSEVGGLSGYASNTSLYESYFTGKVYYADSTGTAGKFFGRAEMAYFGTDPAMYRGLFWLGNNAWADNQAEVKWSIGQLFTPQISGYMLRVNP